MYPPNLAAGQLAFIRYIRETELAPGCPVRVCSGEFSTPLTPDRRYEVAPAEPSHMSGRGWSRQDAYRSCTFEAVERYSAMFRGDEPRRFASFSEVSDRAVAPERLQHFSQRQYHSRDVWNQVFGKCQLIPEPFDHDTQLEWTECRNLATQDTILLPSAKCYLRYVPPEPVLHFSGETTGCAAGETHEDAIVSGFLEVVERDAVALWWYNRLVRPGIDLDACKAPELLAAREYLSASGRKFQALDLTADSGIPTIAAVSATDCGDAILFGTAAHFDPVVAALRAVSELIQLLGPSNMWTRDSMLKRQKLTLDRRIWIEYANVQNQRYVSPDPDACHRLSDLAFVSGWQEAPLQACLKAAQRCSTDIYVADLTRPDVGVPVVKVIVPEMRSSWAQLASGRLYDTPVLLGWQQEIRAEDKMNSLPYFL